MDAQGLMNALIAFYADKTYRGACTSADLLIHAAEIVKGMSYDDAVEFIGDEIADRRANMEGAVNGW